MNQEIEYAEMLEIPVTTISVVKRRKKGTKKAPSLPETLIEKINRPQASIEEEAEPLPATDGQPPAEQSFETTFVEDAPAPTRWTRRRHLFKKGRAEGAESLPEEEEGVLQSEGEAGAPPIPRESKAAKWVYRIEFACAGILCLGIFLTNVFLPGSAINTFFRTMTAPQGEAVLSYEDFTLSSIVGEYSTATVSVSGEGVVSFTAEGCVYPCADGKVVEVLQEEGAYVVKVEHSPSFTSVLTGVDYVYYQIGDTVKHNVPIAYSKGDTEVQMTMYSGGELLTCVQIDKQNCLTWAETQK